MKKVIESQDNQFLRQLHTLGPSTISQLCESLGITATAVRQRLSRLEAQSLLERKTVRSGRGRPHHTYEITVTGMKQLGENYEELATVFWQEILNIPDADIRANLIKKIQDTLVKRMGGVLQGGESLEERLEQLQHSLNARGFDSEIATDGDLPALRNTYCPHYELAHDDPSLCELEQAVFSQILGADIYLSQCCLKGDSCCEFEMGGD